jgi:hypothetical protein
MADVEHRLAGIRADAPTDELRRIQEAHRTISELHFIAKAAHRRLGRPSPFAVAALRTVLDGAPDEQDDGVSSHARNFQFQLYVAATLTLCGLEVTGGEPDMRIAFGTETLGVAAKRLRTSNETRIQRQLIAGAKQLRGQRLRGFVAINVDIVMDGVVPTPDLTAIGVEFAERAAALDRAHGWLADYPEVLGVLSFGYAAGWREEGELAHLHFEYPMRFESLARIETDRDRVHRLFEGIGSRIPHVW